MNKNVVVVVQARMGSTRLPKKALKPLNGKPLLERVYERLALCKNANKIVIATSIRDIDNEIEDFCKKRGMAVFRGSEDDVLDRFYRCARKHKADVIVRITVDNPLIDWENIDKMVSSHIEKNADITYTDKMPYGTGRGNCVIAFSALEIAAKEAAAKSERPDPDDPIADHPERFNVNILQAPKELQRNYRLTVDYPEDFQLMEKIFSHFKGIPRLKYVLDFLDDHPEIAKINKNVG